MLSFLSYYRQNHSDDAFKPHVLLPVDRGVEQLALDVNHMLDEWWDYEHPQSERNWRDFFQPVAPQFLHLTLGHVEKPTKFTPHNKIAQFNEELSQHLADMEPFTIRVGPIQALTVALNLYVEPHPALAELAYTTRHLLRKVFGSDIAPAEPAMPWRPHIATAYCVRPVKTERLNGVLSHAVNTATGDLVRSHDMVVDNVIFVDQHTTHPDGLQWNRHTVRTLALGHSEVGSMAA